MNLEPNGGFCPYGTVKPSRRTTKRLSVVPEPLTPLSPQTLTHTKDERLFNKSDPGVVPGAGSVRAE